MVLFKSFKGCVFRTKLVSFHSRCREWGQRSDTVQQIKEPCLRVFPGFFRGPHREGESPPYAEKVPFQRAGIKKAHAVILCCCNSQSNGNSQLRVPWNLWWENQLRWHGVLVHCQAFQCDWLSSGPSELRGKNKNSHDTFKSLAGYPCQYRGWSIKTKINEAINYVWDGGAGYL